MEIQDIRKTIVTLASVYSDLNELWETDKCITDAFQVLRQEKYREFYEILNQSDFESLVLNVVVNSLDKNTLSRLSFLVEQNIHIYGQNQQKFDGLDFLALCRLDEQEAFDERFELLYNDLKTIQEEEYPTEQEKQMLLTETRKEINQLQNEKSDYVRERKWLNINYYSKIYQLSKSFLSIINDYFPVKEENSGMIQETQINEINLETELPAIENDMIFRAKMYERFLLLEQKLINDKYLNEDRHWISAHENKKPDIKSLIVFLTGLNVNGYFLPNRDPKIKQYFETRYHIKIGQNFERKRREAFTDDYKIIFHDYTF